MDMNLITFWVATIIGSFGAQFVNELRLFKDVADAGYKVDMQRMKDFQNRVMPNTKKTNILSLFIPIFNIAYVCKNIINYNNNRPMILDQLNAIGVLEEMTGYEKREYSKKPTGLNAIVVPLMADIRLKNAFTMTVKSDAGTNKYYWYKLKNSNIELLKVEGPLADLSFDEQEKKFLEEIGRVFNYVKDNYGSFENYRKSLTDNKDKESAITQSVDTDTKTKELEEEPKQRETQPDVQENIKVYKKIKKR